MRRVVVARKLPAAPETKVRRQNGKNWAPPTRESVASTEAPSPPTFTFGAEMSNQLNPNDDGQHPTATFNFATAAASSHARAKRASRTAVTAQPRWSSSTASCPTGAGKQHKTASTCEDPCRPCSILSMCSGRNCPCAKARRPCQNCDSSHGRCTNTVAAHNAVICETNHVHLPSLTAARFCARMGFPPRPLIPLIVEPAERTGRTMSLPQRLLPQPNVTSDAFNARMGSNPPCPELPVRETMWECRPMEVIPAPPH
jgi:hypothetical protein